MARKHTEPSVSREVLRALIELDVASLRSIALAAKVQPSNLVSFLSGMPKLSSTALGRLYHRLGVDRDGSLEAGRVYDWCLGNDLGHLAKVLSFAGRPRESWQLGIVRAEGDSEPVPGEADNGVLYVIESARHRIRVTRRISGADAQAALPLTPENLPILRWRRNGASITLPKKTYEEWVSAKKSTLRDYDAALAHPGDYTWEDHVRYLVEWGYGPAEATQLFVAARARLGLLSSSARLRHAGVESQARLSQGRRKHL